jgi:hypothetical protein
MSSLNYAVFLQALAKSIVNAEHTNNLVIYCLERDSPTIANSHFLFAIFLLIVAGKTVVQAVALITGPSSSLRASEMCPSIYKHCMLPDQRGFSGDTSSAPHSLWFVYQLQGRLCFPTCRRVSPPAQRIHWYSMLRSKQHVTTFFGSTS